MNLVITMYRTGVPGFLLALASSLSLAAQCEIEIGSTDQMSFTTQHIEVSRQCKQFTVTLKHVGSMPAAVMGHNWVLAKAADVSAVANDGISAGAASAYLKPADDRVLASTKLIGGGESASVTFEVSQLKAGETYAYFCSFPGHWAVMKGQLQLVD
ncbi:Azurin [compost metagenome]